MGIWDTLTGKSASDAANAAAADTYGKQQTAISGLNNYASTAGGGYDPYINAGGGALSMLQNGLGLNGPGGSANYTAAYHAQPGYQSGLDTGMQAAQRQAQASGMGNSGAALKGLYRYGSNYEDQRSGDYLGRLMGLQGQGLQAVGGQAGLRAGLRGQAFGGEMNAAGTIGQGQVAGANAEQQGWGNILKTGAGLAGMALGGPAGGMIGSTIGGGISSGLSNAYQAINGNILPYGGKQ